MIHIYSGVCFHRKKEEAFNILDVFISDHLSRGYHLSRGLPIETDCFSHWNTTQMCTAGLLKVLLLENQFSVISTPKKDWL